MQHKQGRNLRQVQTSFWRTIFHICHKAETGKEKNNYFTSTDKRTPSFKACSSLMTLAPGNLENFTFPSKAVFCKVDRSNGGIKAKPVSVLPPGKSLK